jgi:thiosulfate/3-mercaptopyruvate sulfurtransferase
MRTINLLLIIGFVFFFTPKLALAANPLVTPEWVLNNISVPGTVYLDTRHPGQFRRGTVPGAVNTSYGKDWRVKRRGIPGLIPTAAQLGKLIGKLGIRNDDHVVILAGGYSASEMGVATRIYWTFKVAGHDTISILDGGMQAYFALGKKAVVGNGNHNPEQTSFVITMRSELLATDKDIHNASNQTFIDHRPPGQYLGINKSSAPTRAGTLKTAHNIPAQWLTVNDGGQFRSVSELRTLFKAMGVDAAGPVINFCNTGHWASVGWFITHELMGNHQSRLYDGSMAEWTRDPKNMVEQKVPLN